MPPQQIRWSELAEPDTIQTLLDGAKAGLNHASICQAAGIHPRTLQRWSEYGEAHPDSPQGAFVSALKRAKAQGQLELLNRLKKHGEKQWLPNAWLLERTDQAQFALQHKEDSGPKVVVQIGIKDSDVSVAVSGSSLSSLTEISTGDSQANLLNAHKETAL